MIKNTRKITYRSTDKAGQPIPAIFIQGIFLRQYGFNIGDAVDVKYGSGFVHISTIIKDRFGPKPFGVSIR